MDDKIKIAKGIVKFVAARSVGATIIKVLKNNVPTANRIEEIQLIVGSYVIGGMVTDRAVDWTGYKFDEALEALETFRSLHKERSVAE